MSEIKLAGVLPKGSPNGLGDIALDLVQQPSRTRVIIAIVDVKEITTHPDTGEVVPTVRIRRVEPITGPDASDARRLLERAMERRHGGERLPFELTEELDFAFEGTEPTR